MFGMRSLLALVLSCAAASLATPAHAAAPSGRVELDRVAAVVGDEIILLSELEPGELRVRAPVWGDATAGAAGAGRRWLLDGDFAVAGRLGLHGGSVEVAAQLPVQDMQDRVYQQREEERALHTALSNTSRELE